MKQYFYILLMLLGALIVLLIMSLDDFGPQSVDELVNPEKYIERELQGLK